MSNHNRIADILSASARSPNPFKGVPSEEALACFTRWDKMSSIRF